MIMKIKYNGLCKFTLFVCGVSLLYCSTGCRQDRHMLVASTVTVLGIETSSQPTSGSPQGTLGYKRAELALVPTNRTGSEATTGTAGGGASDTAEVLLELKQSSPFSLTGGGIYQRLAVGKIAVAEPGAAFMFARDVSGKISDGTAESVSNAVESLPSVEISAERKKAILAKAKRDAINVSAANKAIFDNEYDKAAVSAGFTNYVDFAINSTADKVTTVYSLLEANAQIKPFIKNAEE